ncbi:MAG: PglZ domain-containing protein [Syntrophobacteraceae bacterium]
MIVDAIIAQFQQRFEYEKRAQVCLWFDEKGEFSRVLPAIRDFLGQMKKPPFVLLEYDPETFHGQIWIKHQVYKETHILPAGDRAKKRFVVYLPLSEERMERPDENGEHHLELLTEYGIAGLIWQIGGKRPTLFSFIRQIGIGLPENPSDQRKLWDGGRDSLLSKYVSRFSNRPAEFWNVLLTPEMAQTRLIGDVDQTIFDLAFDPDSGLANLQNQGFLREFLNTVREQYGFDAPMKDPADWIQEFVTVLALTETFLAYGESPEFPFIDRLPALTLRERHVQLLRRWLRDAENRPVWDRWITEVEAKIDLSSWASDREGLSFAFPHLVKLRWDKMLEGFEPASAKLSDVTEFFEKHSSTLQKEVEFSKSSHISAGPWHVLTALGRLLTLIQDAKEQINRAESTTGLANIYVELAPKVDGLHLDLRRQTSEHELPTIGLVADRAYADYANILNQRFFEMLSAQDVADVPGIMPVKEKIQTAIWHAKGKRAVLIVDGLRYDCAHAIKEALPGFEIKISPLRAMLPAVTPIGMTALLPLSDKDVKLEHHGNNIRLMVGGKDMSQRENRLDYLIEFGADCHDIGKIEETDKPPKKLGDLLVVFGHEAIDHIGHGNADVLIRHLHLEIEQLARLIRKLHKWGYPTVHVVTDHGFILVDPDRLPPEVTCKEEWCYVLKERFALIPAHADIPPKSFPFEWDERVRVAVPPGMAFFRREKAFSHGGATLQEMIIPHLISRSHAKRQKSFNIEVVISSDMLVQGVVKVTLRAVAEDVNQPLQTELFAGAKRSIILNVLRSDETGMKISVLAGGKPKEVQLDLLQNKEQKVSLFFGTSLKFQTGELLDLDIRDAETGEQFPPGGLKLTIGRNM